MNVMKRMAVLLLAATLGMGVAKAQDSAEECMSKYEQVVKDIEGLNTDDYDPVELDSIRSRYERVSDKVSKVRSSLSDKQLKRYYSLKARYQKKLAMLRAKRGARAVEGWIRGMTGN